MKARTRAQIKKIKGRIRAERTVTVDLLPSCRWRCSSVWLNHVCFMFLLPCRPPRSQQPFLRHLFSLASSNQPLIPSNTFFLPSRPANVFYSILFFFSFQMVQAIQVLRFHLLELEKVSILHVCIMRLITLLPIQLMCARCVTSHLFLRYLTSYSLFPLING